MMEIIVSLQTMIKGVWTNILMLFIILFQEKNIIPFEEEMSMVKEIKLGLKKPLNLLIFSGL